MSEEEALVEKHIDMAVITRADWDMMYDAYNKINRIKQYRSIGSVNGVEWHKLVDWSFLDE